MDAAAHDEPHDGRQVSRAQRRADALHNHVRNAEDGGDARNEHGEQLERVPFVREVARDLGLDGEVGVDLPREEREVAGRHGEGVE
jgi:hypothetical protein